jgi:phosphopantothenoylcysteine decarboxylase / phosphopantothenate---cysteine ligase
MSGRCTVRIPVSRYAPLHDMTSAQKSANPLQGAKVVLGVGGGIAAYKAVELLRHLTSAGAEVRVVMTASARRFVGELTFQALSGRAVFTDLFDLTQESEIGHIQVADGADLVIVAPATANLIARMAAGMADEALTAVLLATRAPVLLAPSMNVNMWSHPLTRANLTRLVEVAGTHVVGPGEGFLACRWTGPGRLAEPADIAEAAARVLTPQDLAGHRVVVSAGPTREPVDPVRFLSNRSSGKMGYAIARAAARRGAEVTLVSGPVALEAPVGVACESVVTARDMERAVAQAAEGASAVVMAAAVADFRPIAAAASKIKKERAAAAIELEENPDILLGLGQARAGGTRPILVGFAAETERALENARAKLAAKGCDLVVANDVSQPDAGFDVDTNRVIMVTSGEAREIDLASKDEVAHAILDWISTHLQPSRHDT